MRGYFLVVCALVCLLFANVTYGGEYSTPLGPMERTIALPPPASAVSDAKAFYYKIKKVSSKIESGQISYRDYTAMVADLKADFDIYTSEQRDFPDLVVIFKASVNEYIKAAGYWHLTITGDRENAWSADQIRETKLRNFDLRTESFKFVDAKLSEIDNMFYELKKKSVEQSKQ